MWNALSLVYLMDLWVSVTNFNNNFGLFSRVGYFVIEEWDEYENWINYNILLVAPMLPRIRIFRTHSDNSINSISLVKNKAVCIMDKVYIWTQKGQYLIFCLIFLISSQENNIWFIEHCGICQTQNKNENCHSNTTLKLN